MLSQGGGFKNCQFCLVKRRLRGGRGSKITDFETTSFMDGPEPARQAAWFPCPGLNEPTIYVAFLLASSLSSSFLFSLFGQKLKLCWAACLFFSWFPDSLLSHAAAASSKLHCTVFGLLDFTRKIVKMMLAATELWDTRITFADFSREIEMSSRDLYILTSFFLPKPQRVMN